MKTQDLISIKVKCHSGYKADEYPLLFYWDNICFEIQELLDRWYEKGLNPDFPATNYFKVKTMDQKVYILKHEPNTDKWFLLIWGESINL